MNRKELLDAAREISCEGTCFSRWASEKINELISGEPPMDNYYRIDDDIDEDYEKYEDISDLYRCDSMEELHDILMDWYDELLFLNERNMSIS